MLYMRVVRSKVILLPIPYSKHHFIKIYPIFLYRLYTLHVCQHIFTFINRLFLFALLTFISASLCSITFTYEKKRLLWICFDTIKCLKKNVYTSEKWKKIKYKGEIKLQPHTVPFPRKIGKIFTIYSFFFAIICKHLCSSFTLLLPIIGHVHKIENFDFGRMCIHIVMILCYYDYCMFG